MTWKRWLGLLFAVLLVTTCRYLWNTSIGLRTDVRWPLLSSRYKRAVLESPEGPHLQHVEWDRWDRSGGSRYIEYLVHDPNDGLRPSQYGVPEGPVGKEHCDIVRVWRMEREWYLVTFWYGRSWEDCTPN